MADRLVGPTNGLVDPDPIPGELIVIRTEIREDAPGELDAPRSMIVTLGTAGV